MKNAKKCYIIRYIKEKEKTRYDKNYKNSKSKKYRVYCINDDVENPVIGESYEVIDSKPPKINGNGYFIKETEDVTGKYEMTLDEFCRTARKVED